LIITFSNDSNKVKIELFSKILDKKEMRFSKMFKPLLSSKLKNMVVWWKIIGLKL